MSNPHNRIPYFQTLFGFCFLSAKMEKRKKNMVKLQTIMAILVLWMNFRAAESQLSVTFYKNSCPRMESIVRKVFLAKLKQSPANIASALLRLFFHDCFVEGCDASILLSSTGTSQGERDSVANGSFPPDAFDTVFKVKAELESRCPGIVSCADIIAVLAREASAITHGPSWQVEKGRRDGRVMGSPDRDLPRADWDISQLTSAFVSRGFTKGELVALSGAHTIGKSHCNVVMPVSNSTTQPSFAQKINGICTDQNALVALDPYTPARFDNLYFKAVSSKQGLLKSDQALMFSRHTRRVVEEMASNQTYFFRGFVRAMRKLGALGVKTGSEGEIRRDCTRVN